MPARSPFAAGWLLRPFLGLARDALSSYADSHRLAWCDDPDNATVARDRNYLRHEVLPRLVTRWPAASATLARSASHCAEAAGLLDAVAEADLAALADPERPAELPLPALCELPAPRRRWLLRRWLAGHGLTPPGSRVLARVDDELLAAAADRNPVVAWPGGELRRYRDAIHLLRPGAVPEPPAGVLAWDPAQPLVLPWGRLHAVPVTGRGLAADRLDGSAVTVRFRHGGERLRLPGGRTRTLKKLLQEAGVLPWQRPGLPLVYIGGALAAVADRWVAAGFEAVPERPGLRLVWRQNGVGEASGEGYFD
jgi:tRNA(Ile)-lysidine synthase